MEFAKGTVKKYSREYTRTLKDGKKKKYKTEQVQITVPKSENIFEDREDVIILRNSDFQNIEDNNEMIIALELFNTLMAEDNAILESKLNQKDELINDFKSKINDSNLESDLELLKEEISSKNKVIEDLNDKIKCFKEELESKDFLLTDLQENLSLLRKQLENLPKEPVSKDNFSKAEHLKLESEFIKLSNKFEILQEDLFNAKVNSLYYKNLANKYKNFILKLD